MTKRTMKIVFPFFLHCDSLQIYISNNAQTRKLNDRNKQKNYNKKKKTNGTQNHSHGHVVFTWHVSIQMKPFSFCVCLEYVSRVQFI